MSKIVLKVVTVLVLLAGAVAIAGSGLTHPASAAEPKAEKAAPETDARLQAVLRDWDKANNAIRDAHYQFRWTSNDPTFQETTTFQGEAFVKKPDLLRLNWKDDKGRFSFILYYTGKTARLFDFAKQTEAVYPIPAGYPDSEVKLGGFIGAMAEIVQERVQWMYGGFPVEQLQKRYRLRVAREDDYYVYVRGESPPQRGWFSNARGRFEVVLDRETHRVRRVWFEAPNKQTTVWDFQKVETNVTPPITPEALGKDLPRGWRKEPMSLDWPGKPSSVPPSDGGCP